MGCPPGDPPAGVSKCFDISSEVNQCLTGFAARRKTTASFSYADHFNLDAAILRATLFCAVVGDRLGSRPHR